MTAETKRDNQQLAPMVYPHKDRASELMSVLSAADVKADYGIAVTRANVSGGLFIDKGITAASGLEEFHKMHVAVWVPPIEVDDSMYFCLQYDKTSPVLRRFSKDGSYYDAGPEAPIEEVLDPAPFRHRVLNHVRMTEMGVPSVVHKLSLKWEILKGRDPSCSVIRMKIPPKSIYYPIFKKELERLASKTINRFFASPQDRFIIL